MYEDIKYIFLSTPYKNQYSIILIQVPMPPWQVNESWSTVEDLCYCFCVHIQVSKDPGLYSLSPVSYQICNQRFVCKRHTFYCQLFLNILHSLDFIVSFLSGCNKGGGLTMKISKRIIIHKFNHRNKLCKAQNMLLLS